MIDFTTKNLEWLSSAFNFKAPSFYVEQGDATIHKWDLSTLSPTPYALTIACETYLGPPLTRQIPEPELKKMIASVNKLHEAFLKNIGSQIKAGTRLCLAVPAWRRQNGLLHLPVLEKLSSLGYNWVEFKHVDSKKLIYDREDQFVARQLVTLIKK